MLNHDIQEINDQNNEDFLDDDHCWQFVKCLSEITCKELVHQCAEKLLTILTYVVSPSCRKLRQRIALLCLSMMVGTMLPFLCPKNELDDVSEFLTTCGSFLLLGCGFVVLPALLLIWERSSSEEDRCFIAHIPDQRLDAIQNKLCAISATSFAISASVLTCPLGIFLSQKALMANSKDMNATQQQMLFSNHAP